MFSDLFWTIYWINVLASFPWLLLCPVAATCVYGIIVGIRNDTYGATFPYNWWKPVTLGIIVGLLLMLVPPKSTMYIMLGIKTTEHMVESSTVKKLQELVDLEIDGYIGKLTMKKE